MSSPNTDRAGSIVINSVAKTYGAAEHAVAVLEDVSANVSEGEFVSIIGESGCGKSTLLKIMAGLVEADSGEVMLIGRPARAGRRDVGMMLQTPALLPWRDVLSNVMLPLRLFNTPAAEARARAREVIKLVGLEGAERRLPWQLSGGMQQRVSLARLLSFRPAIQLMDEPFGALDEILRESLNLEVSRLYDHGGQTVVFVTHSIQEAVLLSDRVLVMASRPGRIARQATVQLTRPRTADVIRSSAFADEISRIRQIFEDVRQEQPLVDERPAGADWAR